MKDNPEVFDAIAKEETEIRVALSEFDEAKQKLEEKIGEANGIFGLLKADKVVRGMYKYFKSFDEYANKAARLIVTLYNEATQEALDESLKQNQELSEIIDEVNQQGRGFSALLKKDKHELIDKFSPEFQTSIKKAIEQGTIKEFLMENITDLEAYVKEASEERDRKIQKVENRTVVQDWEKEAKENEIEAIRRDFDPFNPRYLNRIIRKYTNPEWYSSEFKALSAPELKLYDKIIEINTAAKEAGYIDYLEIGKFVPFMAPSLMDKMKKNGLRIDKLPADLMESLNQTDKGQYSVNQITGEKIKRLPKPFTYEIENPSKELGQALILYTQALAKYKAMSKIDSQVNLILSVEKSKKHLAVGANNEVIMDEVEGALVPRELPGNEENAKLLSTFVDYLICGERYPLSIDATLSPMVGVKKMFNTYIRKPLGMKPIKEDASSLSLIKLLDAVNRGFQLKSLGGSPISGAVNWFGANIQAIAQKNDYYLVREFWQAQGRMNKIFQWTEKEASKFVQLSHLFNPFTENENYELYKRAASSGLKRWSFQDALMVFMRRPEMQVQSANFESILRNMMVENGKIINITKYVKDKYKNRYKVPSQLREIEAQMEAEIRELKETRSIFNSSSVDENNQLTIPGLDLTNQEEIRQLSVLSKNLYRRITGGVSETSVNWMKMDVFTSSMMVFKNWIPKLWYTRFGELEAKNDPYNRSAYDIGTVKVFFTAMTLRVQDKVGAIMDILQVNERGIAALDEMYNKYAEQYYKNTGEKFTMDKDEFYDMIRQKLQNEVRELQILMLLIGTTISLGFIEPPDDDKEQKAKLAVIKNITDRFVDELTFFYLPTNFQDVLSGGIFPGIGLFRDIETFMSNFGREVTGYNISKSYLSPEEVREKAYPIKYGLKLVPGASAWLQFVTIWDAELAKEFGIKPPSTSSYK